MNAVAKKRQEEKPVLGDGPVPFILRFAERVELGEDDASRVSEIYGDRTTVWATGNYGADSGTDGS